MTIKGVNQNLSWRGNQLINIGNDIEYKYDASGIRTYKHTPLEETYFTLEGNKIIGIDKNINGVHHYLSFIYDNNDLLSTVIYKNKKYFYIKDALNNILGIINSDKQYIVSL